MTEPEDFSAAWMRRLEGKLDAGFGDLQRRLDAIEAKLGEHADELNVVSGLAMRATGERVAWATVGRQLKALLARVEALEHASTKAREQET
jgi:hypothetical protein